MRSFQGVKVDSDAIGHGDLVGTCISLSDGARAVVDSMRNVSLNVRLYQILGIKVLVNYLCKGLAQLRNNGGKIRIVGQWKEGAPE